MGQTLKEIMLINKMIREYTQKVESFAQMTKDLYLDIYYVSDKLAYSLYIACFYYTVNTVTHYIFVCSGYFDRILSMTHERF